MKGIKTINPFLKNTFTVMGGTIIAQALPILLAPVLARIYQPEDFAVFAFIIPIITIGALLASLRFDVALVIPKSEKEASNLLSSVFLSLMLITILTAIAVAIIYFSFDSLIFGMIETSLLWYIPIGILAIGLYQALNYWNIRQKQFKLNAVSKITQASVTLGINILIGFLYPGAEGLIMGFIVGYVAGSIIFLFKINSKIYSIRNINIGIIKELLRKYKNFAFVNTPHSILGVFVDQGIIYVLNEFFNEKILGNFAFAFRYIKAPLSIITMSIGQVFYQQASELANKDENIRPLMWKIQRNLFFLTIIPFVVLFLFTPEIFAFVFSEKYTQAGEIARYILPWIFMNLLTSPISGVTLIYKKQKEALFIALTDFVFRVLAIIIGGINGSYAMTFILMSIFCSIILVLSNFWYYQISKPNTLNRY